MLVTFSTLELITEAEIEFEPGDEGVLLECMMVADKQYEEWY